MVRFDRDSYDEINKDSKTDLLQCDFTWNHKLECELKKSGIKKVGTTLVKYKKWSMVFHFDHFGSSKVIELLHKGMSKKNVRNAGKKETQEVYGCAGPISWATVGYNGGTGTRGGPCGVCQLL
jgi:hypothetical protein